MEKALILLVIMGGGAALTFARRWKNNDSEAGHGIAGWSMFLAVVVLIGDS